MNFPNWITEKNLDGDRETSLGSHAQSQYLVEALFLRAGERNAEGRLETCYSNDESTFWNEDIVESDNWFTSEMLQKFRDTMRWKSIASYYIETIFYHELERNQNDLDRFLRAPKTWLFMHVGIIYGYEEDLKVMM